MAFGDPDADRRALRWLRYGVGSTRAGVPKPRTILVGHASRMPTGGSGSASRSPRPRSGNTGDSLTRRRSAHRRRSRPGRRSRVLVARVRRTGPNGRRPCSQSHGSRRACRRWWRAPPAEPEVAGGVVTDRINGHPITLFERGIVVPGGAQDAPGYLLEGGGPADERSELRR
jgi:hypothetical protein